MPRVDAIFDIRYGSKAYHSKEHLVPRTDGTPLVASGARNNGVQGVYDIPADYRGVITVAQTGSAGAANYHGYPCAVGDDALVLQPKSPLTEAQMLWTVAMLRANRFRFNYARKVTPARLGALVVPDLPPKPPEFDAAAIRERLSVSIDWSGLELRLASPGPALPKEEKMMLLGDLFEVRRGTDLDLCNLTVSEHGVLFVSRSGRNNGVVARVEEVDSVAPRSAGLLTVALGGSVLETFVHDEPFYTAQNVAVLTPRFAMTLSDKLHFATAIRMHQFRYNYQRHANRTLTDLRLPLPHQI